MPACDMNNHRINDKRPAKKRRKGRYHVMWGQISDDRLFSFLPFVILSHPKSKKMRSCLH
ncbi:hypothetical protein Lalb_Chr04g0249381 [Lupinus albus]|uniref:Uncharacterized protein n=1 Tax=Lupinus albus TaxID=3870 RepID=A0A6A4QN44_LUPAL|nr:hypothetical protein Lalb_Chr04g0249381 [Lupinus albus]